MSDNSLNEILQLCLELEGLAISTYDQIAMSSSDDIKTFWQGMADQEREHAQYWKLLIRLAVENKIHNIFDDPIHIIEELKGIAKDVKHTVENIEFNDVTKAFLIAYRLEFSIMHPAFQALFLLMRNATGDRSPGDSYQQHIQGLIKAYRQFGNEKPAFELIADLSEKLLERNNQVAQQLAEIRSMRGLIPICMHCKNIRKDDGFWVKVETYVEDHSEAEFSHGICPDCLKKYYGEYFKEDELP